jgi:hypothetical protein
MSTPSALNQALFAPRLLARHIRQKAGLRSAQPKLFFIGFNKTGTKTLHNFFRDNGYLSVHSSSYMAQRLGLPPITKLIQQNRDRGLPLLTGLDHYDVYSDMISLTESELIEANGLFREFDAQNPGAYFVFNDRPVENWILSRLSHEGGPRGSFVGRYAKAMKISVDEAPERWRTHYARHKAEVLEHFAGNPRFMVFNIESDDPPELAHFLSGDFSLDPRRWSHHGSAATRFRDGALS